MKIWIGLLENRTRLVEDVERVLRAQGHEVSWRSYPQYPTGEWLEKLITGAADKHEVVSWLLEPDEGREDVVANQTSVVTEPLEVRPELFRIDDETILSMTHSELGIPLGEPGEAAFRLAMALLGRLLN